MNIDGTSARNPRRARSFQLDPRLDAEQQTGKAMYRNNDLDCGHLVRRLDPCWGDEDQSNQANTDSMYYPNISPQHKDLNQKIWSDLEDHVLGTVDERDFRASVFTGCVFKDTDPEQKRSNIKVPMAFWKFRLTFCHPFLVTRIVVGEYSILQVKPSGLPLQTTCRLGFINRRESRHAGHFDEKRPNHRWCQVSPATVTFCRLRRRASQPISHGQEKIGGNCKIFSYRWEFSQEFC